MPIRGEGVGLTDDSNNGEGSAAQQQRIVYVLHPNCDLQEV